MLKIVICGASFTTNFGDLLFAQMFHERITTALPDAQVRFLRTNAYVRERMGLKQAGLAHLINPDAIVYMSGGLFSGYPPRKSLKNRLKRLVYFMNYFAFGLYAAWRKKPLILVGVEAGPLYGRPFLYAARRIFGAADTVNVRNQESFDFLRAIGVDREITVSVDSALATGQMDLPKANGETTQIGQGVILVHVTKGQSMRAYIDNIVAAAAQVYGRDENTRFVVTDDYMVDNPWLNEAAAVLPADRASIHHYDDPFALLDIIKASDTIITPKLHLGIFGCLYGKTVFSFPVHPEKTTRFYRQIGYSENCRDLNTTSLEDAAKLFERRGEARAHVPDEMKRMAMNNFHQLDAFCLGLQKGRGQAAP